ncbi:MAG: hypothetical protein WCS77_04440 [Elusimicrobiaceae bacterium]|jgi:hypothetical protein
MKKLMYVVALLCSSGIIAQAGNVQKDLARTSDLSKDTKLACEKLLTPLAGNSERKLTIQQVQNAIKVQEKIDAELEGIIDNLLNQSFQKSSAASNALSNSLQNGGANVPALNDAQTITERTTAVTNIKTELRFRPIVTTMSKWIKESKTDYVMIPTRADAQLEYSLLKSQMPDYEAVLKKMKDTNQTKSALYAKMMKQYDEVQSRCAFLRDVLE